MRVILMLAAFFAAVMAFAADYFWENGSADWGSTASYRDKSGKIPAALPGETDVLNFTNATVEIKSENAAALERLNAVKYVLLEKATLTFNCADDVTLKCGINSSDSDSKVVKKGKGALTLAARDKSPSDKT